MKVKYTTNTGRLNVEINADSVKDTFKQLAEFQEVFDEECCGMCQNNNLQFIVRTIDNNDYYELKCKKCFAKLAFGQHRSGKSLFPKRRKEDGSFDIKYKGWHKWKQETESFKVQEEMEESMGSIYA